MPSLVKNVPVVLEKKTLKVFNNVIFYFPIISPLARAWSFVWTNLISLHPMMFCAKSGWNWPSGSGEEYFLKVVNLFLLFSNYPSFRKGVALHLNKLEIPSPRNTMCQVWLKMSQWFWTRRLLKVLNNVFLLFCNYLHFEKGVTLHLNKPELYSPKDALCQVWLKMA